MENNKQTVMNFFLKKFCFTEKKTVLNYTREHAHHFFLFRHRPLFIFLNGMGTKIEDVGVLNIATH